MIFSAAFKVYSHRQRAPLHDRPVARLRRSASSTSTPHYNSIFNVLDRESLTPILQELITRSALPLNALETDFAVDSTGFGIAVVLPPLQREVRA